MTFKNIDWIFFDLGSTLVDESRAYEHRIKDAVKGTGIEYQQVYEAMIDCYRQNKKGDSEVLKQYGLPKTKWHSEDEILYPEAKECLNKLSKSFKIGIIANQLPGTGDRLKAFGISEYIDLIVASAEEGVAKPDLKIFKIALERAGCSPENSVMVGDRLDNDIVPANILGMGTVWIKQGFSRYITPQTEMELADHTVNDLSELCALFC